MDIRRVDAEPTNDERQAVDGVLGEPDSSWEGGERGSMRDAHSSNVGGADTRSLRHLLLPALQGLQSRIGWISQGGLGYVCRRLTIAPADAYGGDWRAASDVAVLGEPLVRKTAGHAAGGVLISRLRAGLPSEQISGVSEPLPMPPRRPVQ